MRKDPVAHVIHPRLSAGNLCNRHCVLATNNPWRLHPLSAQVGTQLGEQLRLHIQKENGAPGGPLSFGRMVKLMQTLALHTCFQDIFLKDATLFISLKTLRKGAILCLFQKSLLKIPCLFYFVCFTMGKMGAAQFFLVEKLLAFSTTSCLKIHSVLHTHNAQCTVLCPGELYYPKCC